MDIGAILKKKLDLPAEVFFRVSPSGLDHEIAIEARVIDADWFGHSLGLVTGWFRVPKRIGQGEMNALIKRNMKQDAQQQIDAALEDFRARGFRARQAPEEYTFNSY